MNERQSVNRSRELVSKLIDSQLSSAEGQELRLLLQADNIAQEFYFDQLFMDGLLNTEFGSSVTAASVSMESHEGALHGLSKSASTRAKWFVWQIAAAVCLVLIPISLAITLFVYPGSANDRGEVVPMVNSGFETTDSINGPSAAIATWFGDEAEIVESWSHVRPVKGNHMLRFTDSTYRQDNSFELFQIVDLRSEENEVDQGDKRLVASAFFNCTDEGIEFGKGRFAMSLYALDSPPTQDELQSLLEGSDALAQADNQVQADDNAQSWQEVSPTLDLPENTNFVLVRLAVTPHEAGAHSWSGQNFVDNVSLNLVNGR